VKDLVAFSVYDTKPVHFLSTACTNLCWKEISKKVYDKDSGISIVMKFLPPYQYAGLLQPHHESCGLSRSTERQLSNGQVDKK
jgi:hypothetical protein